MKRLGLSTKNPMVSRNGLGRPWKKALLAYIARKKGNDDESQSYRIIDDEMWRIGSKDELGGFEWKIVKIFIGGIEFSSDFCFPVMSILKKKIGK